MQQIKSTYVFAYTIYALVLCACAVILLFKQQNGLWIGVLLTVLPGILMGLWRRFLAVENHADERDSVVTALALVGLAVVLVGDSERGWLLLFAFSGVVGLLLHTYWASAIGIPERAQLALEDLQALDLYDVSGARRKLSEWCGRPCLVLVLRGSWCPFSAVQLRKLTADMSILRRAGVVCVMPQPPQSVSDRISGLEITVLQLRREPENRNTGLVLRGGVPLGLSLWGFGRNALRPSLVVLDAEGSVRYQERANNYRLPPRLENALSYLK